MEPLFPSLMNRSTKYMEGSLIKCVILFISRCPCSLRKLQNEVAKFPANQDVESMSASEETAPDDEDPEEHQDKQLAYAYGSQVSTGTKQVSMCEKKPITRGKKNMFFYYISLSPPPTANSFSRLKQIIRKPRKR